MNGSEISLMAAFAAGLVSFLSPCVLPVVPVYLAILAGTSNPQNNDWRLLRNSIWFMAGFTVSFVAMGATASFLGQLLLAYQDAIRKIGAVFMITMGGYLLGHIRLPALSRDWRPLTGRNAGGPVGAMGLGMAVTIGWTPCVGPILASILVYAGIESTLTEGIILLLAYAAGFAVPFLSFAIFSKRYMDRMRGWYRWLPPIQKAAGAVLIILGGLLYFNLIQKGLSIILIGLQ